MKIFFLALLLLCQGFMLADPTCIVILTGSGSTGKTSITQALSAINSDWYIIDEDQLLYKLELQEIQKRYPNEFEIIEQAIDQSNMLSAIQNQRFLFKQSADKETREQAKKAIAQLTPKKGYHFITNEDIIEEIQKGLALGKNIILDDWFIDSKILENAFPETRVICVLVYSSLFVCHERFKKRNKNIESNLDARFRVHGQLVCYYTKLYKLTNNEELIGVLPSFCKSKLEHLFNKISKKLRADENDQSLGEKTYAVYCTELTVSQLQEIRNDFIVDTLEEEPLFFEPQNDYDIVLNYEKRIPQLAAMKLLQEIYELHE